MAGFWGDIKLIIPGISQPLIAEVKSRSEGGGFKTIEGWLGSNDMLFLLRDFQDPLVVLPWDTYRNILDVLKVKVNVKDEEAE